MSILASSPAKQTEILAAAGVPAATASAYYGAFTSEDEQAVLNVALLVQTAWETNDADAFADAFTENGSLLMQDDQLMSRDEIRAYFEAGFKDVYKGARVTGWPLSVKFLNDEVAMVVTEGGILLAGDDEVAPERQIRATWMILDQDDTWKLVSHQSSPLKG